MDRDYADKYVTYKLLGSRLRNEDKSKGSIGLIEYFDKCLRYNGFKIKDSAKSDLVAGVGEIIGNAEEHSGTPDGEWHVLGCYNKDSHLCDFVIINYGRTIYESLSDKTSTAAEVIKEVEEVILSHRTAYEVLKDIVAEATGKLVNQEMSQEEPIWNVMALQDGISSQRTAAGAGSTRGQGIMDFLAFISGIKSPDSAEIVLLSGRSLIKIDYRYPISTVKIAPNGELRRRMAFNTSGDLRRPSDPEKVIYLRHEFPGTIFAGSFKIDQQYLEVV